MLKKTLATLTALAIMTGGALAATKTDTEAPRARAFIPFADMPQSVDNWKADGRDAIWIEGRRNQWYRAEFMAPCTSLPFAVTIGFVTDGTNRIDEFSSILVDNERCWFKTFEPSDGPPSKKDKD